MLLRIGTGRFSSRASRQQAEAGSVIKLMRTDPEREVSRNLPSRNGGLPADPVPGRLPPSAWAYWGERKSPSPIGGWAKRLADVVTATAALFATLPFLLLIALLIRATSKGPIIYGHDRVGFAGRTFRCFKFRTMVVDSDRVLAEHLARDPAAAGEWERRQKLARDPRVTAIGQILRKTSLDEVPQLINILRGEMSCVGPRPVTQDELQRYGPISADYMTARPGLTGLWQVTGRSRTDYDQRVLLDAHYLRNWSMLRDLGILCRTTLAVIRFDDAC